MKIAVVHEWLVNIAGSEKVLAEILSLFPQADLFAVVDFLSVDQRKVLQQKKAKTTFIQGLPRAKKSYTNYLPLMPIAIEQLDLSEYDVILSSSHAVAKGVLTGPNQLHISYVHSPIRYAWDLQHQYLNESGLKRGFKSLLARIILHYIRIWDLRTANGVDIFLANSEYIARRIKKVYGRESTVIYPPVDLESFALTTAKEDFYVVASRMVPYKKMPLIVEAFSRMPNRKLVVIGDGPDMERIKKLATSNIKVLGYQSFDVLSSYMQKAKAFVFAAEEDFGITPIEAQACGTPVIAFGRGGARETVRSLERENPTGLFFSSQTVDAIVQAVEEFEKNQSFFTAEACRKNAEKFSMEKFRVTYKSFVENAIEDWSKGLINQ